MLRQARRIAAAATDADRRRPGCGAWRGVQKPAAVAYQSLEAVRCTARIHVVVIRHTAAAPVQHLPAQRRYRHIIAMAWIRRIATQRHCT